MNNIKRVGQISYPLMCSPQIQIYLCVGNWWDTELKARVFKDCGYTRCKASNPLCSSRVNEWVVSAELHRVIRQQSSASPRKYDKIQKLHQGYIVCKGEQEWSFFFLRFLDVFQMIVVVGVGVALSCFKVKVPFIIAIKHTRCGRKKRAGTLRESMKIAKWRD